MTGNLINRPFELLSGIVLRFALAPAPRQSAPGLGIGKPLAAL
jgi:hypothetical protein